METNVAYDIGYQLGLLKRAALGCAAEPLSKEPSALIPRRDGMRSNHRRRNFERTDLITRPAMKV